MLISHTNAITVSADINSTRKINKREANFERFRIYADNVIKQHFDGETRHKNHDFIEIIFNLIIEIDY